MEIEWMVGRNAVEGIKFHHLLQGDEIFDKWDYIEMKLTEIDVGSLSDPVEERFEFFHDPSSLCRIFTFFGGMEHRCKNVRHAQDADNRLAPGYQQGQMMVAHDQLQNSEFQ